MWSLKNLVHSPATRKHVQQGARGLEDVSLGKEGGGGELYGILECSSDIEGKKVSILVPSTTTKNILTKL